jgi:hypothetical protein
MKVKAHIKQKKFFLGGNRDEKTLTLVQKNEEA